MTQDTTLFARENEVTDAVEAAITDAIVKAYPNKAFFYLRLRNKWGVVIEDDVTHLSQGARLIVAETARYARAQGRLLDLLALAWSDVQGNPALKALADEWLLDQAGVLAKYGAPPVTPPVAAARPSLEKLVASRSRLIDLPAFIDGLERLSGALCRIGIPEVQGTGFLVGRRTVLTNFHVVHKAIQPRKPGDNIVCEFDYHGAANTPVTYAGLTGDGWLLASSPYSQSDLSGTGEPAPNELDFALIRLASDVEATRRPLAWPIAPPIVAQRDFVAIGQHPGGKAAKIAIGEVLQLPGSGLRYRYDVTTEGGSSGSPVLDMDLGLVALHHAADPDAHAEYNQAVPIARIMKALTDAGIDLAGL